MTIIENGEILLTHLPPLPKIKAFSLIEWEPICDDPPLMSCGHIADSIYYDSKGFGEEIEVFEKVCCFPCQCFEEAGMTFSPDEK